MDNLSEETEKHLELPESRQVFYWSDFGPGEVGAAGAGSEDVLYPGHWGFCLQPGNNNL